MNESAVTTAPREGWAEPPAFVVVGTGIGLGIALGALSYLHPRFSWLAMIALVVAAGAIFVRVIDWRVGLMVLLIVASLIDRFTYPVGSLNLRPEQVAAGIVGLVVVVNAVRSRNLDFLRPRLGEIFIVLWFAIGLASSIIEAPSRGQSLKVLALLVISALALFLPTRLIGKDKGAVDEVVYWLLLALLIESAYAVLSYFLHLAGPTISMSVNPAGGHFSGYGTLWEPNVLGAISGAGVLGWVHLGRNRLNHYWIGAAICFSACVISLTRAALLAVVVVLVLSLVLPRSQRPDLKAIGASIAGGLLTMGAVIVADRFGHFTTGTATIGSLSNGTDVTGRLNQFRPAFMDLRGDPIFGLGIDSFGQRHMVGGAQEHLANLELTLLNDTGILGMLLVLGFISLLVIAAWGRRHDATVLGLTAVILVVFITNQATQTIELMVTWLLLGLLAAAIHATAPVIEPGRARKVRGSG